MNKWTERAMLSQPFDATGNPMGYIVPGGENDYPGYRALHEAAIGLAKKQGRLPQDAPEHLTGPEIPPSKDMATVSIRSVTERAESREPRAESREPRTESREPRAESREPRAESPEPRAESGESEEKRVGVFVGRTSQGWFASASAKPRREDLWHGLLYQGELACLFADSNAGKSILAVQMARDMSRQRRVAYFDFEMDDTAFMERYSDEEGKMLDFPENFTRVEMDSRVLAGRADAEDVIFEDLERYLVENGIQVAVIDNLSYMCARSESGEEANRFMVRFKEMRDRTGTTILIMAHTPKRDMTQPVTQNDMAGSKRLVNYFDNIFTLGVSARDESLRYIKQVKFRKGPFAYSADSVLTCEIVKEGAWLHLKGVSRDAEAMHLERPDSRQQKDRRDKVIMLRREGKSYAEIASELAISKATVSRILKSQAA